jgi:choline transport protein
MLQVGRFNLLSNMKPTTHTKTAKSGWLTVAGWQAGVAASLYILGTLIQGLIQVCAPNYVPQLWHGTLLFYAIIIFCVLINLSGEVLPKVESAILFVFVIGFIACMVPMVWLSPHASAKTVFTTWINDGGWSSQGTSFFVGLAGNAFVFLGMWTYLNGPNSY